MAWGGESKQTQDKLHIESSLSESRYVLLFKLQWICVMYACLSYVSACHCPAQAQTTAVWAWVSVPVSQGKQWYHVYSLALAAPCDCGAWGGPGAGLCEGVIQCEYCIQQV